MKGVYSPSNYEQCILINFLYDGNHNPHLFVIANSTLKEYEIITLIYNKIMQDAKKISPSQACQKLNPPLFNLPSLTPPQFCPTPNFLDPSASIKLPLPNKDVCIYIYDNGWQLSNYQWDLSTFNRPNAPNSHVHVWFTFTILDIFN